MKTHMNQKARRHQAGRPDGYETTGQQRHMHRQQKGDQTEHSRQRKHMQAQHHEHEHGQEHDQGHGNGNGQRRGMRGNRHCQHDHGNGHHEHDHEHECYGQGQEQGQGRSHKRCRHHDSSEHGERHGRGRRRNLPLTSAELGTTLRSIAKKHDYIASRGPHAGDGNPSKLVMAMARGDIATVSLAEDALQQVIDWLEEQATHMDDAALVGHIQSLTMQLRDAAERKQEQVNPVS